MIGSMSKMSSLPPLRMHGMSPRWPSFWSAMVSHRSRELSISASNRWSLACSESAMWVYSSGVTTNG